MLDRRTLAFGLAGTGTALLGCAPAMQAPTPAPQEAESLASLVPPDVKKVIKPPQCLVGLPDAPRMTVVAASLHCDASRQWFRENGKALRADLLSGARRLHLTHLARTANEVPVAVELLKAPEADYPAVLLGAFALATSLDEPLSLAQIEFYLEQRGIARQDIETEDDLAFAVIATQHAFHERTEVRATPYVMEMDT